MRDTQEGEQARAEGRLRRNNCREWRSLEIERPVDGSTRPEKNNDHLVQSQSTRGRTCQRRGQTSLCPPGTSKGSCPLYRRYGTMLANNTPGEMYVQSLDRRTEECQASTWFRCIQKSYRKLSNGWGSRIRI